MEDFENSAMTTHNTRPSPLMEDLENKTLQNQLLDTGMKEIMFPTENHYNS